MATPDEMLAAEQLADLKEIADQKGWSFDQLEPFKVILGMKARDETPFWLLLVCDQMTSMPPAWHWYNEETGEKDNPSDIPLGGQFLHDHGVVCAPWNRLAYRSVDPRGPHTDWTLANWLVNPKTGGCKTLSAMALRINLELRMSYTGKKA